MCWKSLFVDILWVDIGLLLIFCLVSAQEVVAHWIAECRLLVEQTRLLTLCAAKALDTLGSRAARKQVKLFFSVSCNAKVH